MHFRLLALAVAVTAVTGIASADIQITNGAIEYDSSTDHYTGPIGDAPMSRWDDAGGWAWSGKQPSELDSNATMITYESYFYDYYGSIDMGDPSSGQFEQWEEMYHSYTDASWSLTADQAMTVTGVGNLKYIISVAGSTLYEGDLASLSSPLLLAAGTTYDFRVLPHSDYWLSYSDSSNWYDPETEAWDYSSYSSTEATGTIYITDVPGPGGIALLAIVGIASARRRRAA